MDHVVTLLLLVLLAWVRGAAPDAPDAAPHGRHVRRAHSAHPARPARHAVADEEHAPRAARASGSCRAMSDCAWGFTCEAGACVEAECHDAHGAHGRALEARTCLPGLVCTYEDGAASAHGVGLCDAR